MHQRVTGYIDASIQKKKQKKNKQKTNKKKTKKKYLIV